MLVTACSDPVDKAQEVLSKQLDEHFDLEFKDAVVYSGGAVCGQYRNLNPHASSLRFKPFITWNEHALARPSPADIAFFCTEDSESALLNEHGIGPIQDQQANLEKIRRDFRSLEAALDSYRSERGTLPAPGEGLTVLIETPENPIPPDRLTESVHLQALPLDPWGRPYGYAPVGLGGGVTQQFDLYTLGADGQQGGTGENADVRFSHLRYLDYLLGD